jgi:hypothetical protein
MANATPAKLSASPPQRQPAPLCHTQAFAKQRIGTDRHEKWRGVEEHHGARRRGQLQTAINQDEFEAEQRAGEQTGAQGAVALEQLDAAQPRHQQDHQQCAAGAQRRLQERRNVLHYQFDGDLVEPPGQAEHQHQRNGAGAERAPSRSGDRLIR